MGTRGWGAAALALVLLGALPAAAQELEPRAYVPVPPGFNVVMLGYAYSEGGIVTDPALPVTDIDASVHMAIAYYGRTFALFGRSASAGLILPWGHGDVEGSVGEERRSVTRVGGGDPRFRVVVNLLGGPALSPQEMRKRGMQTSLGLGFTVVAPWGEYDSDRLINIGTNRWSYKTELGLIYPRGRWMFELYGGVWVYRDNPDYFGGHVRSQDPVASVQGHLSYNITPLLWAGLDLTYYYGGETSLDGGPDSALQSNTRTGLTVSIPVARRQAVKFACSRGVIVRFGSNFTTCTAGWQMLWAD
jgi:hypothetical protein